MKKQKFHVLSQIIIRFDCFNILLISWIIFLILLSTTAKTQTPESNHFKLQKLADGVYAAIHKIGGYAISNSGFIDLGEKTLIFDTFLSPDAAKDLKLAAEMLTSNPIVYVVNSHAHDDHIRGNQVFVEDASIISTSKIRGAIANNEPEHIKQDKKNSPKSLDGLKLAFEKETDSRKRQEIQMWLGYHEAKVKSVPTLVTILPDVTFENKITIHGTKRKVELYAFNKGHTESDIILFLPEEKIVFTGDLVFIKMHPYLADGFPESWIESLNKIKEKDVKTVVPGHGPVGNVEDMNEMIRYIKTTEKIAKDIIALERPVKDMSEVEIPQAYKLWWFSNFFRINLKFMYSHLLALK